MEVHLERIGRERGHYIPVLAWGESGVGKSESVKRAAAEMGLDFVDLRLGQQEVGVELPALALGIEAKAALDLVQDLVLADALEIRDCLNDGDDQPEVARGR